MQFRLTYYQCVIRVAALLVFNYFDGRISGREGRENSHVSFIFFLDPRVGDTCARLAVVENFNM